MSQEPAHDKNAAVWADGAVAMIPTVAIVGVGLIGGSFAAALRRANAVGQVLGVGRRAETIEQARKLGIIDRAVSLREAAQEADLILVSAPVGAFAPIFAELGAHLRDTTVLTDGGSTKQNVVEAARAGLGQRIGQFVPAHPMAGSHESGPQAADPMLYSGRRVMVTPLAENSQADVARVESAWRACGAQVSFLDPRTHDAIMAAVSHLPHWIAALYMQHIMRGNDPGSRLAFAGPGFRDFTRIAAGSPEMWRDIFLANRAAMLDELASLRGVLDRAEQALRESDAQWLEEMLDASARARRDWKGPTV